MEQWMFRITDYAQSLLDGLDELPEWPQGSKDSQRNWIGRLVGAEVDFAVQGHDEKIRVYTTRPDTLFGATYMVLAPEHPLIDSITTAAQRAAVDQYRLEAGRKSDLARTDLAKEKTGVFTGGYAINPVNGEAIPVWIADYVLISYGTGAIMSVPGHDERDFEFAEQFDLPILRVLVEPGGSAGDPLEQAWTGDGVLCHSSNDEISLDGKKKRAAIGAMTAWLQSKGLGAATVRYKLRDWVFARQRYWGEPFPLVFKEDGSVELMEDAELPLALPHVDSYAPTDSGESPLSTIKDWVNIPEGTRETDTMPNWAGSSWYWIRFMDPHNDTCIADMEKQKFWGQVDLYVGGREHLVLHDLYARFWNHALYDLGHVPVREPFKRLLHQGMVLGADGKKMSKSKGGISPDEIVGDHGADVLRMHLNFLGPPESQKLWNPDGLKSMRRFLERVRRVVSRGADVPMDKDTEHKLHVTIKGATADYKAFALNTVLAKLMELTNHLTKLEEVPRAVVAPLLIMLSPQAPHFCDEMGDRLGFETLVCEMTFPDWDEKKVTTDEITLVAQVNGKVRDKLSVPSSSTKEELEALALACEGVARHIEGKTIRKVIVVPGRLVNIVAN
jgi:leucyl-tRNA synthetase